MQVNANVGAQLRDETRFQSSSWLPLACCALGNLRQGGQVSTEDGILRIPEERGRERESEKDCHKSCRKLSQIKCLNLFTFIQKYIVKVQRVGR